MEHVWRGEVRTASRAVAGGRQLGELRAIAEVGTVVSQPGDPVLVYERVARIVSRMIQFDRWSIATFNEHGGYFTEVFALDCRRPGWRRYESFRLRGPLAAEVIEDGRIDLLLGDLTNPRESASETTFPARFPSMMRVPIEFRGRLVGSLTLRSERPRSYNRRHLKLVREIGARIAPTVEYFRLVSTTQLDEERRADDRRGRSVMLATLSEQLRNPLSAARTASTLITDAMTTGQIGAIQPKAIDLLNRSIERLNSTVERAFDYAVLEHYGSPIAFQVVNLAEIIVREFELFEQIRRRREIRVDLPKSDLAVDAYAEPVLLRRCLRELIDNAHRYTPNGGSIAVRVIPEDRWISVDIVNTGVEIPAEELRLVFIPFYRSARADAGPEPGIGLGLNIAKAAVRLHGGTLAVESSQHSVRVCLKIPSAVARAATIKAARPRSKTAFDRTLVPARH